MRKALLSPTGVITLARLALGSIAVLILAMPGWEALGMGQVVHDAFAPFCHQAVDRSLVLMGVVMPVCARCAGLYLGALMGALAAPWLRPARALLPLRVLVLAAVPMALDLGLENLGGTLPHASARLLTGLTLGAVVAAFLLPALVRAGEEVLARCATRNSTYPG